MTSTNGRRLRSQRTIPIEPFSALGGGCTRRSRRVCEMRRRRGGRSAWKQQLLRFWVDRSGEIAVGGARCSDVIASPRPGKGRAGRAPHCSERRGRLDERWSLGRRLHLVLILGCLSYFCSD